MAARPIAAFIAVLIGIASLVSGCSSSSTAPSTKTYPPLAFPAHFSGMIQCMTRYTDSSINGTRISFVVDRADSLLHAIAIFEASHDTVTLSATRISNPDSTILKYHIQRWIMPDSVAEGWYNVQVSASTTSITDMNWPYLENDYYAIAYRTD